MLDRHLHIKGQSDDPDTQTIALLICREGNPIAATNTVPRGVIAAPDRISRPAKYSWIEHAERNALFAAARQGVATEGSEMFIEWFPCADCARAIVQAGVSVLHCGPQPVDAGRYGFDVSAAILLEGGVDVRER